MKRLICLFLAWMLAVGFCGCAGNAVDPAEMEQVVTATAVPETETVSPETTIPETTTPETTVPENTTPETTVPETAAADAVEQLSAEPETDASVSAMAGDTAGSSGAGQFDFPLLVDPQLTDFVPVELYLPEVLVDLKYATEDNFTGQVIYDFQQAYIRYGTAMRLKAVAEELAEQGLYLKLWDAYRPRAAQFALWEACPNAAYVADPNKGNSGHSRGHTVDVTLVDEQGRELEMPSGYDDFSALANRDYSDCSETAAANASLLQSVMEKHGFLSYWAEWWHYTDSYPYDVEQDFEPHKIFIGYADCKQFITLREEASGWSDKICTIDAGEEMIVMDVSGKFAYVDYQGLRGYVLASYVGRVA